MSFRSCFFLIFLSMLFLPGCSAVGLFERPDEKCITVMTYNTQGFFDAIEDGSEFAEFRGFKSKWSEAKYIARLDRLREVLLLCGSAAGEGSQKGPDIIVLQEIENGRVVRDLCNRLPRRCGYKNAAFIPPEKGDSFGTVVLSRFPFNSVSAHTIGDAGVSLRPLMEVSMQVGSTSLVVFALHWKSKSGLNESKHIRALQEELLLERISILEKKEPSVPFIVCGDFNQTRSEFTGMNYLSNCWDWWLPRCLSGDEKGPTGSYYFRGTWETIDSFFYSPSLGDGKALDFERFQVISEDPLFSSEAMPYRYDLFSGRGYSDHLPLVLVLKKVKEKPAHGNP